MILVSWELIPFLAVRMDNALVMLLGSIGRVYFRLGRLWVAI